jgi:tetratricopeptide (TPR) repeat protein
MTCDEKIVGAQAALQQGNYDLSEQLYREILLESPENPCALDGLGILLCRKGETEGGIILFEQALNLLRQESPQNSQWEASILFHLGLSYRTLGLRQEALNVFIESARHAPPEHDLVLNLGQVHFELEQYEQAAEPFRTLTNIQPDNPSAWLTLGFILSHLNRHDEAAEVLRMAETLDPASPEIGFYFAEALRKAERYEESLRPYQKMLQVGAEYPQAVHGYGKSLLALGNLDHGWDAMEFRFVSSLGTWERHDLDNWAPGSNHKHILAYSEEGIGAELMFASCLPDLINSVEHCVVECEESLHSLFRRSFPRADFVPLADDYVRYESNPWGIPLDAQIAFGSLPRYFRRNVEDFPLRKSYLVPNQNLIEQWSTRLAGLGDARKIGILWKGTWTDETPGQTSLPIQELRGIMNRHQGAAWISLQHGSHQKNMNQYRGSVVSPHFFPEAFRYDLDMMAALISSLDLVITPPGYVSHLAGALGVRTWLLLPEGADWRHTIDVVSLPRSVWHPSIRMYRQTKGQTWRDFFATIEDDLEKFMITYRPPEEMPVALAFPERTTIAYPKAA